jgi:DNA-binding XRE family transcriptional regulator
MINLKVKLLKIILEYKHFCLFLKHNIVFMWYRIFLLVFAANLFMACESSKEKSLNEDLHKTIGAQIREERLQKGISQQDLADAIGVTQNGLSLIEDGLATPIHTKLIAIQNHLGVKFKFNGKHTSIEGYLGGEK